METEMENRDLEQRVHDLKARTHGRWSDILRLCGVDEKVLNRRNQPCPSCGGTDRFQYTDKYGDGSYHCRGCGPGDGFKLLQAATGIDFIAALRRVGDCIGIAANVPAAHASEPSAERMKKLVKRIWDEACPVARDDDVDRYLRRRGLAMDAYPQALRCHPSLGYYVRDDGNARARRVGAHPAMLACVQDADGQAITLHRTYLHDGRKAALPDAKKLLSAGVNGAAVRLFAAGEELAVAEGIETALSVHLATGKPVWAAISAGNMEKLLIPDGVRRVCIYADNDAGKGYDGQAAAFALARRLRKERKGTASREVEVFVPRHAGADWADVWLKRRAAQPQAA
jgi:putative DNA primase/helicase